MFAFYALVLTVVLIGAVLTSEPSAWEPVSLVVALTAVAVRSRVVLPVRRSV